MTNLPRILFSSLLAAALASIVALAQAKPEIRTEMGAQAGMKENTLPCSVCHEHGNTYFGSVRTPFGLAVRMRGLDVTTAKDGQSLQNNVFDVVHKMNEDKVDSDGDGVEDIKELSLYTDPNIAGPVPLLNRDEVSNGCHCSLARPTPSTPRLAWALAGVIGLAAISVRRASRSGRPSRA